MKSSPGTPLVMVEAQFVLELLEVALDAPADFNESDKFSKGDGMRNGREPIFCGFGFPDWPFDQKPFGVSWSRTLVITMCHSNAQQGETRLHHAPRPLAPANRPPRSRRKFSCQDLHRQRSVVAASAKSARGSSDPMPALCWQRSDPWGPNGNLPRYPHSVGEPARRDRFTKLGHYPVTSIGCHRRPRQLLLKQSIDLLQGNLPLGPKANLGWNPCRLSPLSIPRPYLGQVQTISARHTHGGIDQRKRHRDLTIVLLAQRSTVLPSYPNGVSALLRNARIIDYPRPHSSVPFQLAKDIVPGNTHHLPLLPRRVGRKVVHRLMACPNVARIDLGCHWLYALSLPRKQKAPQVRSKRFPSIRMSHRPGELVQIIPKPVLCLNPFSCHDLILPWRERVVNL